MYAFASFITYAPNFSKKKTYKSIDHCVWCVTITENFLHGSTITKNISGQQHILLF